MRRSNRKTPSIREAAKRYVIEQIELLKRHGTPVRVSKAASNSMVSQVVRASLR